MRNTLILLRRELLSNFRSMFAWSLIAGYAACTSVVLLLLLHAAEGSVETLPAIYARVNAVALPLLAALVTMRTFCEERQLGTLESLLTVPVKDSQVVLAKFWAAVVIVVLAIGASMVSLVLYVETALPPPVYSRTGLSAAMGLLFFHACAWVAVGVFSSLLSRTQTSAAIATLLLTAPHSLVAAGVTPLSQPSTYADALSIGHVTRGNLESRPLLLCVSMAILFLFIAIRLLEARRWKI